MKYLTRYALLNATTIRKNVQGHFSYAEHEDGLTCIVRPSTMSTSAIISSVSRSINVGVHKRNMVRRR